MNLTSQEIAGETLIVVEDERIDACVAVRFRDKMHVLTEVGSGRVLLDLGAVVFVDSSGIGAIVGAMKQLAPDRPLELAGLTPNVAKVFRLTRLDEVFKIHPDRASAFGSDVYAG